MPADDEPDGPAIDPFSDLLFALTAALVAVIALLWPLARNAPAPAAAEAAQPWLARSEIRVADEAVRPLWAGRTGIRLDERTIAPDDIGDDTGLRNHLARLRAEGAPLLLMVEPDGQEAAFLLETVAAAHGPATIRQVRLDRECGFVRDQRLAAACRAGTSAR